MPPGEGALPGACGPRHSEENDPAVADRYDARESVREESFRWRGLLFTTSSPFGLGVGASFFGAVGRAIDLDELDTMAESVNHCGDAGGPLENLVPLSEGLVCGDDDGGLGIVAAGNDLV